MEIGSTKFPIAIISTDITALREISWTLSACGYHGVAFSDWSEQAAWRRVSTPALVILDARDEQQIQKALAASRSASFTYRIAIYDANMLANPDGLMDLGADDLVRYPLNAGELVSCIRRGARRLEFERRFDLYATFDQQRGVANRRGFTLQCDRKLQEDGDLPENTLLVVRIDFLESIREQYGIAAVENACSLVAEVLQGGLSAQDRRGILDEGVFAALMAGRSVADAMLFANEVNEQFVAIISLGIRISLSGVVVGGPFGDSAVAIQRAMAALEQVRAWGGGRILNVKDVENEYAEWKQKSAACQTTQVRHFMEPLPLVLPLASAKREGNLGISSFASGVLPLCVPVVDDVGHLLGVVDGQVFRSHGNAVFDDLEEHLEPVSALLRGDTGLDDAVASLESADSKYLLVVENKKPIGYVTHETIAAVQARGVTEASDRQFSAIEHGINSLVVPLI